MKTFTILLLIAVSLLLLTQPLLALDSAQQSVMNQAITGQSGTVGITSATTASTTSYSNGVTGVRLAITLVIAGFYFLFVAWLAKSQYLAWVDKDIDTGEAFGSVVMATLMLLFMVFVLST